MGIFFAVPEDKFAVETSQAMAKRLNVQLSQLPKFVLEAAHDNAQRYKNKDYAPETVARLTLDQLGSQILRGMVDDSGLSPTPFTPCVYY